LSEISNQYAMPCWDFVKIMQHWRVVTVFLWIRLDFWHARTEIDVRPLKKYLQRGLRLRFQSSEVTPTSQSSRDWSTWKNCTTRQTLAFHRECWESFSFSTRRS
jgi:hypothetical protein